MSTEDVNTDQVVTDQDANTEQVVTAPDENTDVVDQQATEQADASQDKTVPYDRFKEVNDQKKVAEEQAAYAQRQLELMQMNAQAQQVSQQVAPKSTMEQAMIDCGTTAEEMGYDGNIQVKVMNRKDELDAVRIQRGQLVMSTQQFAMSHPDINEVVGSVNLTTGQITAPTPELLALVQKKPYLAQASTSDIYSAVLENRRFAEFEKNAATNNEHLTRQRVKTETQPLGGSAAGGGGSGTQGRQGMLSREQVLQTKADIKAGKYS